MQISWKNKIKEERNCRVWLVFKMGPARKWLFVVEFAVILVMFRLFVFKVSRKVNGSVSI